MVHPEIGEAVNSPSTVDLEIGEAVEEPLSWLERLREPHSRRRELWLKVAMLSGIVTLLFSLTLHLKLDTIIGKGKSMIVYILFILTYIEFFACVYGAADPVPYLLRRSEKQLFESAFLVVCSCWFYYTRDADVCTGIFGLCICFDVIPFMNLWLDFENFGSVDCYFAVLIGAALFCCRNLGGVRLAVATGIGIAVQLVKNAYRQYCSQKIKNETDKHLI